MVKIKILGIAALLCVFAISLSSTYTTREKHIIHIPFYIHHIHHHHKPIVKYKPKFKKYRAKKVIHHYHSYWY